MANAVNIHELKKQLAGEPTLLLMNTAYLSSGTTRKQIQPPSTFTFASSVVVKPGLAPEGAVVPIGGAKGCCGLALRAG